ncbi:MAG: phosphopantothenoylcysteine decarboxylase [Dissulfuribacterales bacterium]
MMKIMDEKNIVLCVCGGIAAYKSVELLRLFQKAGADVKVVMTGNAAHFVGPMTFEAISGHPVFAGMYGGSPDAEMRHTREAIDPVRFISNPSSGKMGYAVAKAASDRGADVILVSGPTALNTPFGVRRIDVVTAEEMADAVFEQMDDADIIIKVAAVSDYRSVETAKHKIKKGTDGIVSRIMTKTEQKL